MDFNLSTKIYPDTNLMLVPPKNKHSLNSSTCEAWNWHCLDIQQSLARVGLGWDYPRGCFSLALQQLVVWALSLCSRLGENNKSFAVVIVTLSCMTAAEVWRIWRNNALKKSGGFDTVGRKRIVKNTTFLFKWWGTVQVGNTRKRSGESNLQNQQILELRLLV